MRFQTEIFSLQVNIIFSPNILRKLYSTDISCAIYTNLGLKVGMTQFVEVGY